MFKLHSSSKYSLFDAIYLLRCFSHCSEQFLNSSVLMPFSASAVFVSPLSHWQHAALWGLFSSGETKLVTQGKIRRIGRVAHGGHAVFGQNCWILSAAWAGVLVNHPPWNGQRCWRSLQKTFTDAEYSLSQHLNLVQWYSWVPEHSPREGSLYYMGPSLQKIIPVWGGVPPHMSAISCVV